MVGVEFLVRKEKERKKKKKKLDFVVTRECHDSIKARGRLGTPACRSLNDGNGKNRRNDDENRSIGHVIRVCRILESERGSRF